MKRKGRKGKSPYETDKVHLDETEALTVHQTLQVQMHRKERAARPIQSSQQKEGKENLQSVSYEGGKRNVCHCGKNRHVQGLMNVSVHTGASLMEARRSLNPRRG